MVDQGKFATWRKFWERGGWWRAVLVAAAYFVLYEAGSLLFAPLAVNLYDQNSASSVVVLYMLPILLGGIILVAFALSLGWLREMFQRQPIRGSMYRTTTEDALFWS